MPSPDLVLFALNASRAFGQQVAEALHSPLGAHEEREFEDGEHKARPLQSVRGRDVYVVQSLYSGAGQSVNDKLCRLLFFIGALKDAAAARVTAVVPYLGYSRKDRKTKPRDPTTTRYMAALFEAVGTDRVVTLDVHNLAAFQNAFRIASEHLDSRRLFADHFAARLERTPKVVVVSPDIGGVKRAEAFREALSRRLGRPVGDAFMEKHRSEGVVTGETLVGEVRDASVLIVDDMISTGGTILRAARACRTRGATAVYAVAAHGLLLPPASDNLAAAAIDEVTLTDTVQPFEVGEGLRRKLVTLSAAGLFADAIACLHENRSLIERLEV